MGAETNTEHRESSSHHHHHHHHHHSSGRKHRHDETRRSVQKESTRIRRRRLWKNLKRIVFVAFFGALLSVVLYLLMNPNADINIFSTKFKDAREEQAQDLEREVEKLQEQLEWEK